MKAIGVTEYAHKHLSVDDIQYILNHLPSNVEPSEEVNSMDEALVWVEDMNECIHQDFLIIEP